jgi:alkylated DNA repair dioxygenase AlkB
VSGAPAGLAYFPEFVSAVEERELADRIARLEFHDVVMHGLAARRRAAHFGWLYGYESWRIEPGPVIPNFLLPLRDRAAALAELDPAALEEVLVTEYPPGAGIGWHRDAPMFGPKVVGVSLLSACRMRFQRGKGADRKVYALEVAPRSAYVLAGEARAAWQHSIPKSPALRYSITFRTVLRSGPSAPAPSRPERAPRQDAPGRQRQSSAASRSTP